VGFNNVYHFKGGIKEIADKVGRNVVDIVK
jgi:predicted sulfurtransferase